MNIQELMKQAQKMQKEIKEKEKRLNQEEFTFSRHGIELVISGGREIKKLTINPALADPDDMETLEELLIITINEALLELNKKHEALMPTPGNVLKVEISSSYSLPNIKRCWQKTSWKIFLFFIEQRYWIFSRS